MLVRVLLALAAGIWLWVFLPPLEQLQLLSGADTLRPVLAALVLAQCLPSRVIRAMVAFLASEWYMLHYFGPSLEGLWASVTWLVRVETGEVRQALSGLPPSDPLVTHLFLWALAIVYWLVVFAARRRRLWWFYNVLGVLVLGVIDGNTAVHPDQALVVVCIIAVLVGGLGQLADTRSHPDDGRLWPLYLAPLLLLVTVASLFAWVMPKPQAVWADPFRSLRQSGNKAAPKVIGYQEDSSHLGGSFVMDYKPVLSVTTPYPSYLRGQVLTEYTGKGWLTGPGHTRVPLPKDGTVSSWPDTTFVAGKLKTRSVRQTIRVLSGSLHASVVFGAYALERLSHAGGAEATDDVRVNAVFADWNKRGAQYTVTSRELEDPTSLLKKVPPLPANLAQRRALYPLSVRDQGLQLPRDLPPRVGRLTEEIVKGARNEYDVVERLIEYLQVNYQYQTDDVPVPCRGVDYVDQFLFDSKRGYCNNFASALAVMLRTIDIPTRFVTGFAVGEADPSYTGSGERYIIRNADAHSWVEVYFPEVGWVPFDPTPGFQMPFAPPTSTQTSGGKQQSTSKVPTPKPPQTVQPDPGTQAPPFTVGGGSTPGMPAWTRWALSGMAVCFALAVLILRRRLLLAWYLWSWNKDDAAHMTRALGRLLRLLQRSGALYPEGNATLRDLAVAARRFGIGEEDYRHLLRTAESYWYGGVEPSAADLAKARETWRRWVTAILAARAKHKRWRAHAYRQLAAHRHSDGSSAQ
jgi:transglutaminase-like putative cysteine protease